MAGRMDEARAIQAELEAQDRPPGAWGMATLYAALGEKEKGIRALQTLYEEGHAWTPWITGTQFEPLHDDLRYVEIIQNLNLPNQ